MPFCSRITSFEITESNTHWKLRIDAPLGPDYVNFPRIITNSLDATHLKTIRHLRGLESIWKSTFVIPKGDTCLDTLQRFLRILQWTVTIADDADESHALYLHSLPHPTNDPYEQEFKSTKMGNLVKQAKYGPASEKESAAQQLSKLMASWIVRHPRYMRAEVILPAPASNPYKALDLPEFISRFLYDTFGYELAMCQKTWVTQQQKSLSQDPEALRANVTGAFRVDANLRGKDVIILDDLYGSGETLNELGRACREAGAQHILSLTATKNAKGTRGVTPGDWYDVSMEAEQADDY